MVQLICREIRQYLIKCKLLLPLGQAIILEIYATKKRICYKYVFPMAKDVYTRVLTSASFDYEERGGKKGERKGT